MSNNFQKEKTYLVGVASPDRRHSKTKLKNVKFDESKTFLQKLGSYFIELGVKNPNQYLEENPDNLESKSVYEIWEYDPTENVYVKILSSMPSEVTNQIDLPQENNHSNSNNRLEGLSEKLIDIQQETFERNLTMREEQHEREVEALRMQIEMLQTANNGSQAPFLERMADAERNFKEMLIQKDNIITQLNDKIYNLQTQYLELASEKARLEASLEKEKELSDLRKDLEDKYYEEETVTLGKLAELEKNNSNLGADILRNLTSQPQGAAAVEKLVDFVTNLFNKSNAPAPPPAPNYGYAPPQQPYYQGQPNPYEVMSGGQEQINVDYETLYKQAQEHGAVQPPPIQNVPNY